MQYFKQWKLASFTEQNTYQKDVSELLIYILVCINDTNQIFLLDFFKLPLTTDGDKCNLKILLEAITKSLLSTDGDNSD